MFFQKNKIFTHDPELGKKKRKVREKGRQVWCACCFVLERIWEVEKNKSWDKGLMNTFYFLCVSVIIIIIFLYNKNKVFLFHFCKFEVWRKKTLLILFQVSRDFHHYYKFLFFLIFYSLLGFFLFCVIFVIWKLFYCISLSSFHLFPFLFL